MRSCHGYLLNLVYDYYIMANMKYDYSILLAYP